MQRALSDDEAQSGADDQLRHAHDPVRACMVCRTSILRVSSRASREQDHADGWDSVHTARNRQGLPPGPLMTAPRVRATMRQRPYRPRKTSDTGGRRSRRAWGGGPGMKSVILTGMLLLAACAQTSHVKDLGNGMHAVTASANWGGYTGSREETISQANEFC